MKIFVALLSVFVAVCQILQVQGQPPTSMCIICIKVDSFMEIKTIF